MNPDVVLIGIGVGVAALSGFISLFIILNRWTLSRRWWDSPSIQLEQRSLWIRFRIGLRDQGWTPLWATLIVVALVASPVVLGALGADGGPGGG